MSAVLPMPAGPNEHQPWYAAAHTVKLGMQKASSSERPTNTWSSPSGRQYGIEDILITPWH